MAGSRSSVQHFSGKGFRVLGAAVLGALMLAAHTAAAQNQVFGRVTDDATARPLAGAIVRIAVGEASRVTRSDEAGEFRFINVGAGTVTLSVRLLGFEPLTQTITVTSEPAAHLVRLHRLVMLDTVRVRAAKQGLFGVVATAKELRPLPKAQLKIVGVGGGNVPLDSTGHFFVPIKTIGSYFLRAKADGFVAQTISVIVSPNDGVEVAFLLDTATEPQTHRLEMAMGDFDDRIKIRGLASALVPRSELLERGPSTTVNALKFSRSFAARALRLGSQACAFVDGIPRPGLSLNAIDIDEIEAMEAYGPRADRTRNLAMKWPKNAPCGDTGLPRITGGDDLVIWVAIWLKH